MCRKKNVTKRWKSNIGFTTGLTPLFTILNPGITVQNRTNHSESSDDVHYNALLYTYCSESDLEEEDYMRFDLSCYSLWHFLFQIISKETGERVKTLYLNCIELFS